MQARLLYEKEVLEFDPNTRKPHAPPSLVRQCVRKNGRLYAPIGTLLDDPNCYHIVLMGQAEAVDEECLERTNCPPDQLQARLHAAKRLMAGIEQSDYELFDTGVIVGYDADGNYLPGPNWNESKARGTKKSEPDEGI
jgi:hypothetical protein